MNPTDFGKARDALAEMGIKEFEVAEISYIPNEYIEINDPEDRRKFDELCDMLDELQDVQNVYHNVK